MMSFEEFRQQAFDGIRERLHAAPKDEVEAYLVSLENDVKESYETGVALTKKFGTNHVSPISYAYGATMDF